MDDTAQIDLALTTDFDPSIFDCWDETVGTRSEDNPCKDEEQEDEGADGNEFARNSHDNDDNADKKASRNSSSKSLPDNSSNIQTQSSLPNSQMLVHTMMNAYLDLTSPSGTTGSLPTASSNSNTGGGPAPNMTHTLLPQSMQPLDHSLSTMNNQPSKSFLMQVPHQHNHHPMAVMGYLQQKTHVHQHQQGHQQSTVKFGNQLPGPESGGFQQIVDPALIPLEFHSALAAGGNPNFVANPPMTYYHFVPQEQQNDTNRQQQQPLSTSQPQTSIHSLTSHQERKPQSKRQDKDILNKQRQSEARSMQRSQIKSTALSSSDQFPIPATQGGHLQQHQLPAPAVANGSVVAAPSTSQTDLPPFLLFDAPIELRANFIQSQRQHGMAPMQDNNSLHYGMSVNGFHPQQTLNTQSHDVSGAFSRATVSTSQSSTNVKLIDGRHGNVGNKRVKNAREQKRTQKITDLIDELRIKMERGGWKVGLKSKFHTLSSCAEYVKHLVQANVEKEEALKKAREDLEQRKRKLEDDEKTQQDPSDPESTTSSLTVSSDSTSSDGPEHSSRSTDNTKKEDPEFSEENDPGTSDENKRKTGSSKGKKLTLSSHESSLSSSVSSGGDEGDGSGSDKNDQAQGMSTLMGRGTMGASISDLTDSNRGGTSSSEGHSSGNSGQTQSEEAGEGNESPGEDGGNRARGGGSEGGTGSVSSDAAVARGQDNHGHETCHADVVVTRVRKRKSPSSANYNDTNSELHTYEVSPIDTTFQLDYEEVFLNSNVPQILATTSGRIVAWNDFFLRLTGLNADEVERLTFFSLVPPQHLSSLFEIVAAALRSGAESAVDDAAFTDDINSNTEATNVDQPLAEDSTTEASQNNAISSKKIWNYSALTLPCITFEPSAQRRKLYSSYSSGDNDEPQTGEAKRPSSPASLFITVTLMTDEDPRKRCFHCIFTDCPGTKGSMGSVTPELLSHLFSKRPNSTSGHEATSSKRKRHHRSSHV